MGEAHHINTQRRADIAELTRRHGFPFLKKSYGSLRLGREATEGGRDTGGEGGYESLRPLLDVLLGLAKNDLCNHLHLEDF